MVAPTLDCQLRSQKKTMSSFFFIFFPFFFFQNQHIRNKCEFPTSLLFGSFKLVYLLFLTSPRFRFRVWFKARCIAFVTCKTYISSERTKISQTNVKPSYHRRQIQFFFYRLLSGFIANSFYLKVTICLEFSLLSFHLSFI